MKRIKIAPYGCILHVTDNFEDWHRTYKRLSGMTHESGDQGLTWDRENGNYYVGIFSGGLDTLVHELAHVCLGIADRVQLGNITKEQEQFCYLIGHMTNEVVKLYPKFKGI